jgi:hypothetical protein
MPRRRPAATPDLDRIAAELNRIYVRGGLQTVVAVGSYILDTFFDGDLDAYRNRLGDWGTFRELSRRDDLAMSPSFLAVSVDILLQLDLLPRELGSKLYFSQHRALLPVHDPAVKLELARRAVDRDLSSRDLQRLVWKRLGPDGRAGGPPPRSPSATAVVRLQRQCRELERETRSGGAWERLAPSKQCDLMAELSRVVRRLARVRARLEEARP